MKPTKTEDFKHKLKLIKEIASKYKWNLVRTDADFPAIHFGIEEGEYFNWLGDTPQEAYASLVDKINGKGTWERNPFVWAYDFKLTQ